MGLFGLFGGDDVETPQFDMSGILGAIGGFDEGIGGAFGTARGLAGDVAPLALGAREQALGQIGTPEAATKFFQGFQPTSLEAALADQTFKNIFPDVERSIRHNLSLSGIESSPVLAQQVGRARGELGVDIGTILANQGQQRALASLESRLGIDPFQMINPIAQAEQQQANLKQSLLLEAQQQKAQADFATQLRNYQQAQEGGGYGRLIGAGLGALAAPFTGGLSLGAGLGIGSGLGALVEGDFGAMDALGLVGGLGNLGKLSMVNPFSAGGAAGGTAAGIGGAGGIAAQGSVLPVNPQISGGGDLFSAPSLSGAIA